MAPKRVKASEIVPKEVGVRKLPLHEFDVGEESGWRSLNDDRVAELLKEFLDGHYGMNVLKDPMVRAVAGEPKRSADYKVLLADGKHKVVALQRALAIYEDAEKCEDYEWSDKLVEVFADGLNVTLMEFKEDDTDILLAYQTAAHDEAANQAFWSDLKDFATVAKRWRARTAGGQWPEVQKKLEQLYNGKRMLAYRMVQVAAAVPDEVLAEVSGKRLPTSYFFENKYFLGPGPCQISYGLAPQLIAL